MRDNSQKIITLNSKISRLDDRILYEKSKTRFRDAKQKRSFGKMFVMAGAGKYVNVASLVDRDIIQIGSVLVTVGCTNYKIAIILGGLKSVFDMCLKPEYHGMCNKLGLDYYDKHVLQYPQSLFLGIAIYLKKLLDDTSNHDQFNCAGDLIFKENKLAKLAKYKQYLATKYGKI